MYAVRRQSVASMARVACTRGMGPRLNRRNSRSCAARPRRALIVRARPAEAGCRRLSLQEARASIANAAGTITRPRSAAHALALQALGLQSGDRVAIMGDACEEWMICDLAAQSLGAIVYGIYPTASVSEVEFQMQDGGAAIFIAEDQEYVDKILQIADRLPDAAQWIVVIDDSAMFGYSASEADRAIAGR